MLLGEWSKMPTWPPPNPLSRSQLLRPDYFRQLGCGRVCVCACLSVCFTSHNSCAIIGRTNFLLYCTYFSNHNFWLLNLNIQLNAVEVNQISLLLCTIIVFVLTSWWFTNKHKVIFMYDCILFSLLYIAVCILLGYSSREALCDLFLLKHAI